ncbi:MAG: flagellar biosynthesis anti-sigma factor FlgM [Gammaproteobacteria bacterium]|nr:flagellar biosynthesis anti-sigma factor FlgM [Gammaproteobacteria bacterium]
MTREIDALVAGLGKSHAKGSEARVERGQASQAQDSHVAPVADRLSLTETSARVQELQARVASLPVVDEQRVQEIKQAIAQGSYGIDSARVAEKIVRLEAALTDKA